MSIMFAPGDHKGCTGYNCQCDCAECEKARGPVTSDIPPEKGIKYDEGKLRYDLIPAFPLEKLAEVYTIGAKKYADENWRAGISYKRIFGAMMRHAWAWMKGEKLDQKDGQHHLASVAWCAFALMEYEQNKTLVELDDRWFYV